MFNVIIKHSLETGFGGRMTATVRRGAEVKMDTAVYSQRFHTVHRSKPCVLCYWIKKTNWNTVYSLSIDIFVALP